MLMLTGHESELHDSLSLDGTHDIFYKKFKKNAHFIFHLNFRKFGKYNSIYTIRNICQVRFSKNYVAIFCVQKTYFRRIYFLVT